MAKPAKQKARPDSPEPAQATKGKARSARTLLMAAALLAVASLGGGFVLAKLAFQQDAEAFEPDYVEAGGDGHAEPGHGEEATAVQAEAADHGGGQDGGHGGEGDGHGAEGGADGVLKFDELVVNINGFDTNGRPTRDFLKMKVVLVYRPEPGAAELMEERQPFMRDLFTGYARSLTETDVRGMAGILNVKAELLKRARAAAGSDLPTEILISDLIVQ